MNVDDPPEAGGMFLPTVASGDDSPASGEDSADGEGLIGVGDAFSAGVKKSRFSQGTLILFLVIIAAAGTLFLMRTFGLGSELHLVDVKIDYPIDENTNADLSKNQTVLDELRTSAVAAQVPLNKVKKNPFEMAIDAKQPVPMARPAAPVDRAAQERKRRLELIRTTLSSLEVNSVLGGSVPIARVSGQTVRIGDTIHDLFVVKAIHGRTVDLVVDGAVYSLTMGK